MTAAAACTAPRCSTASPHPRSSRRACRLYPLSWSSRWLGLSPEFHDYSCAQDGGPTVYRLMRPVIAEVFDQSLVQELDRVESKVIRRRLPIRVSLAR